MTKQKRIKYAYFISYFYKRKKGGEGWGDITISRNKKIKSDKDIESIKDSIKENHKNECIIIIMNFQEMK